jgi:divalent metal cation (Fe/Co/Zn/Cd) transporter
MAMASSAPPCTKSMDAVAPSELQKKVRRIASSVPDVVRIEKCWVRKSGIGLLVDIHVEVDANLTVARGHNIGHEVSARLKNSDLRISHVLVHVEPAFT